MMAATLVVCLIVLVSPVVARWDHPFDAPIPARFSRQMHQSQIRIIGNRPMPTVVPVPLVVSVTQHRMENVSGPIVKRASSLSVVEQISLARGQHQRPQSTSEATPVTSLGNVVAKRLTQQRQRTPQSTGRRTTATTATAVDNVESDNALMEEMQREIERQASSLALLQRHMKLMTSRLSSVRAGEEGEMGQPGYPGKKGDQGYEGLPGLSGEKGDGGVEGEKGDVGLKGDLGDKGNVGGDGPMGTKGDKGAFGERGVKGDRGFNGDIGIPGVRGPQGELGPEGKPGRFGQEGDQGVQGFPGKKGERGTDAVNGRHGFPGAKGDQGHDGLAGGEGRRGEMGLVGRPGEDGVPGNKGPIGPPGNKGLRGEMGLTGSDGVKGEQGSEGLPGLPGWLLDDRGYCVLSLGNCPPGFTEIGAYQSSINNYRFGDYQLTKRRGHPGETRFAMRINACCR